MGSRLTAPTSQRIISGHDNLVLCRYLQILILQNEVLLALLLSFAASPQPVRGRITDLFSTSISDQRTKWLSNGSLSSQLLGIRAYHLGIRSIAAKHMVLAISPTLGTEANLGGAKELAVLTIEGY